MNMASRRPNRAATMSLDTHSSHHSSRSRKLRRSSSHRQQSQFESPSGARDPESAMKAGKAAVHRAFELQNNTKLPRQEDLVQLNWDEIFVEDLLGVGGFASVCLVTCPRLRQLHGRTNRCSVDNASGVISFDPAWGRNSGSISFDPSWGHNSEDSMSLDSEGEIIDGYALKCLSNRTMSRPNHFVTGAADLVAEAFLLSRLSHPNVISLYGVTSGNIADAFMKKGGYFLVLEALESTLNDELQSWRREPANSQNEYLNRLHRNPAPSIEERLSIAMSVAKGMEYLHSCNVLFRDLKPENVGFDKNGTVKLFDFGLARECGQDCLRGMAGSILYIAPETILDKYSCKASDVYSYGILLWELASLLRPYPEFHQPEQLSKAVAIDGHRPDPRAVDHPVKNLIERCWHINPISRPSFEQVLRHLEQLRDNSPKPRRIKSAPSRQTSLSTMQL